MAGGFGMPRTSKKAKVGLLNDFTYRLLKSGAKYAAAWVLTLAMAAVAAGTFGWYAGYQFNRSPTVIQLETPDYTTNIEYEYYEYLKKTRIEKMCIRKNDSEVKYCFDVSGVTAVLPNGPEGSYFRVLHDEAELIEVLTGER